MQGDEGNGSQSTNDLVQGPGTPSQGESSRALDQDTSTHKDTALLWDILSIIGRPDTQAEAESIAEAAGLTGNPLLQLFPSAASRTFFGSHQSVPNDYRSVAEGRRHDAPAKKQQHDEPQQSHEDEPALKQTKLACQNEGGDALPVQQTPSENRSADLPLNAQQQHSMVCEAVAALENQMVGDQDDRDITPQGSEDFEGADHSSKQPADYKASGHLQDLVSSLRVKQEHLRYETSSHSFSGVKADAQVQPNPAGEIWNRILYLELKLSRRKRSRKNQPAANGKADACPEVLQQAHAEAGGTQQKSPEACSIVKRGPASLSLDGPRLQANADTDQPVMAPEACSTMEPEPASLVLDGPPTHANADTHQPALALEACSTVEPEPALLVLDGSPLRANAGTHRPASALEACSMEESQPPSLIGSRLPLEADTESNQPEATAFSPAAQVGHGHVKALPKGADDGMESEPAPLILDDLPLKADTESHQPEAIASSSAAQVSLSHGMKGELQGGDHKRCCDGPENQTSSVSDAAAAAAAAGLLALSDREDKQAVPDLAYDQIQDDSCHAGASAPGQPAFPIKEPCSVPLSSACETPGQQDDCTGATGHDETKPTQKRLAVQAADRGTVTEEMLSKCSPQEAPCSDAQTAMRLRKERKKKLQDAIAAQADRAHNPMAKSLRKQQAQREEQRAQLLMEQSLHEQAKRAQANARQAQRAQRSQATCVESVRPSSGGKADADLKRCTESTSMPGFPHLRGAAPEMPSATSNTGPSGMASVHAVVQAAIMRGLASRHFHAATGRTPSYPTSPISPAGSPIEPSQEDPIFHFLSRRNQGYNNAIGGMPPPDWTFDGPETVMQRLLQQSVLLFSVFFKGPPLPHLVIQLNRLNGQIDLLFDWVKAPSTEQVHEQVCSCTCLTECSRLCL